MRSFKKRLCELIFKLVGWRTIVSPPDLPKYVLIVAPHTSNWDFLVGLIARHIIDIRSHFLAKNSLFKIPVFGWFIRSIGGHPVDRSRNSNLVDQVVEIFNQQDQFIMTVAPEGTRSYQPTWKTGFYRIAEKANVPIVMVGFDFARKVVEVKEPFYTTGDIDKDIEDIKSWYRNFVGRNPEKGVK